MITSITFKLEESEKEKIKTLAAREGLTVSQFIRKAVKEENQEKTTLAKIYAAEKAGLGGIDDLEAMVAKAYGLTKNELANKYQEITNKINTDFFGCSNEQFMKLIYAEYLNLLLKEAD